MTVTVLHGDSREIVPTLAADSVHACVCDPPYALTTMVRPRADLAGIPSSDARRKYASRQAQMTGFMGKQWDTGETAFDPAFWAEVLRVLKPGAHLIAFGGTRTYHRLACAIEDAGFEIRDQIGWLYGSGFPKSHDVSKAIDRAAGAEREIIVQTDGGLHRGGGQTVGSFTGLHAVTAPATPSARQWEGWGIALKPAWEPIVLARKPLIGTVAANVLAHGCGALNIDGCRVEGGERETSTGGMRSTNRIYGKFANTEPATPVMTETGRWPANIIHDGSEEVIAAFPETGDSTASMRGTMGRSPFSGLDGSGRNPDSNGLRGHTDSGSPARFFYTSKADSDDRLGSKHPTVKPVDLMAYLCRLVTPPGGTVLDPFAGSGTTGMACMREGFDCILIEREAEYVADIRARLAHVKGEDTPLFTGLIAEQVAPQRGRKIYGHFADQDVPMTPAEKAADSLGNYELALEELRNR